MDIELVIDRTYFPKGTNGIVSVDGNVICYSIELPWLNNQNKISCIPEGRYSLSIYDSPKHGLCLLIMNVPVRSMCEIHAANWAMGEDGKTPELEGCIAPVTSLDKKLPGVGWFSKQALSRVNALVFPVLKTGGRAWITIREANKTQTA